MSRPTNLLSPRFPKLRDSNTEVEHVHLSRHSNLDGSYIFSAQYSSGYCRSIHFGPRWSGTLCHRHGAHPNNTFHHNHLASKDSRGSRSQALDNELPYLIGYITVLAGGGISPFVTLRRISKADYLFPAAAKEVEEF